MYSKQAKRGFTLIELVVVVVLLGLLAAAAIPRLLDITDDAEKAAVEGVAGGFATGVALVRTQWFADNKVNPVNYDQVLITVTASGWPTSTNGTGNSNGVTDQTAEECVEVFNGVLQNPPNITTSSDPDVRRSNRYAVIVENGAGTGSADICRFELVLDPNGQLPSNASHTFSYDLQTGRVIVRTP